MSTDGWATAAHYNGEIGASCKRPAPRTCGVVESRCLADTVEFEWQPDGERRRLRARFCNRTRGHDLVASGLLAPAIGKREDRVPTVMTDGGRKCLKELAWRRNPSKS
ncbi:hypothetical protein ACFYXH_11330 [Streptomyces sp. NPDC002730]|uniref:hypothetical protein n=1 Tax=Streptomyces sp. NPDC002730 TaxID=3364662 RepID=UPI003697F47B